MRKQNAKTRKGEKQWCEYLTAWGSGMTALMLERVKWERARQRMLLDKRKIIINCCDPRVTMSAKLSVLAEEFGEVAREVCHWIEDYGGTECQARMQAELIQVAAVAVAWAESLEEQ